MHSANDNNGQQNPFHVTILLFSDQLSCDAYTIGLEFIAIIMPDDHSSGSKFAFR
jgi:hypothetical protein